MNYDVGFNIFRKSCRIRRFSRSLEFCGTYSKFDFYIFLIYTIPFSAFNRAPVTRCYLAMLQCRVGMTTLQCRVGMIRQRRCWSDLLTTYACL